MDWLLKTDVGWVSRLYNMCVSCERKIKTYVSAGDLVNFSITVDGKAVLPASTFELLRVKFDSKFSTAPHDDAVAAKARQRSSYVARLANFIPKGPLLKILADGLVMGYVSHALAAVAAPWFVRQDDPQKKTKWSTMQVAINDSARTIVGAKQSDRLSVPCLLARAKVDSVNAHVVRAVATETWTAFHSSDGDGGREEPSWCSYVWQAQLLPGQH
jgi:hypothetical protein